MSYLQDKSVKRKRYVRYATIACIVIVLIYFRHGIFSGLSTASSFVFRPVISLGKNVGGGFSGFSAFFYSKSTLLKENQNLQQQLDEKNLTELNYNSLVDENSQLQEILDRKKETSNFVLSAILAKPNQSPYDTILIDVGSDKGIQSGDLVFALGDIPVGRVAEVHNTSAKVALFSNSGEKTQVVVGKGIFMEMSGRGGGNFEMVLPRDFVLQKGDNVLLPGINSYTVAVAETVISDPRDSFIKALLVAPVNVQELKFVEVDEQR